MRDSIFLPGTMFRCLGAMLFSGTLSILVVGLAAIPAAAATTCSFLAPTVTINIDPGETAAVRVSGTAIQVSLNGAAFANCGTATTVNTDTINVGVPVGNATQTLTIDLSGGAFAPGADLAGEGTSAEIEFTIDLGGGADALVITGSTGADAITFGDDGTGEINLNATEAATVDADATLTALETITVNAGNGMM